jgi:hypothetical protein
VVEDFGHSLPTVSIDKAEDIVAAAIGQTRRANNLPQLKRLQSGALRDAACTMADNDRLDPKGVNRSAPLHYVLTYTNLQPGVLPASADKALDDRQLRSFSVGTCFAHTATYPNGVYWVLVTLY